MAHSLAQPQPREGEPFDREPSQLVNLDSYLPFLPDHPDRVPIDNGNGDSTFFVNQHIYFTEPSYWSIQTPSGEIDMRYRRLRSLTWSQIVMRRTEERRLHKTMEFTVDPPPPETVDATLRDYHDIDLVGGAVMGLADVRSGYINEPRIYNHLTPPEIGRLSARDRVDIFRTIRDEALDRLAQPRIVPDKLVTSALKRLSSHLKDEVLEREARERMQSEIYFPLRVPNIQTIRNIGHAILLDAVGYRSLEESRLIQLGLQTGVDKVQSIS